MYICIYTLTYIGSGTETQFQFPPKNRSLKRKIQTNKSNTIFILAPRVIMKYVFIKFIQGLSRADLKMHLSVRVRKMGHISLSCYVLTQLWEGRYLRLLDWVQVPLWVQDPCQLSPAQDRWWQPPWCLCLPAGRCTCSSLLQTTKEGEEEKRWVHRCDSVINKNNSARVTRVTYSFIDNVCKRPKNWKNEQIII